MNNEFLDDVLLQLQICCGIATDDAEALLEKHQAELLSRAGEEPFDIASSIVERDEPR